MSDEGKPSPLGRLLWFIGLWAGGVIAVVLLAWMIRLAMGL